LVSFIVVRHPSGAHNQIPITLSYGFVHVALSLSLSLSLSLQDWYVAYNCCSSSPAQSFSGLGPVVVVVVDDDDVTTDGQSASLCSCRIPLRGP
jgi:hypothetical protein